MVISQRVDVSSNTHCKGEIYNNGQKSQEKKGMQQVRPAIFIGGTFAKRKGSKAINHREKKNGWKIKPLFIFKRAPKIKKNSI